MDPLFFQRPSHVPRLNGVLPPRACSNHNVLSLYEIIDDVTHIAARIAARENRPSSRVISAAEGVSFRA